MPEDSLEYLSEIEREILRSSVPIRLSETDEISVFGECGIWANKLEVLNWKSDLPIDSYQINEDKNPEIIIKKLKDSIEYIHEIAIRYLKPPSPPSAGEIIINQEPNKLVPPAPPLIIRQQPPRPCTPEPLVIREAPPSQPDTCRKVITISGKLLPPPPRKVIIERLSKIPPKPQSVIVERWLPYNQTKRKVIYKSAPPDPVICKPKNLIIQWEAPEVCIKKQIKYLGVQKADPEEYSRLYRKELKSLEELPHDIRDIKYPDELLEEMKNSSILEGDVEALKLVDLDKEGLTMYKDYLTQIGVLVAQSHNSISTKSLKSVRHTSPDALEEESYGTFVKPTASSSQLFHSSASSPTASFQARQSGGSIYSISPSQSTNAQEPSSEITEQLNTESTEQAETLNSQSSEQTETNETKNGVATIPEKKRKNIANTEWTGSYQGSDEFLSRIFNFMDYDNDGLVNLDEVKRTLNILNEKFKRNYVELSAIIFLNTFDRNKDGFIDYDEFKQSIREILSLK